jgi:hypothetical protein
MERKIVNMKNTVRYDLVLKQYEQSISRKRFRSHPYRWVGKWIIGKIVFALYMGIRAALFIGYYNIFIPWQYS